MKIPPNIKLKERTLLISNGGKIGNILNLSVKKTPDFIKLKIKSGIIRELKV